jgi:hypothetical protein
MRVAEQPYFDQPGEATDAPARFVRVADLDPLIVIPGLEPAEGLGAAGQLSCSM